MRCIVWYVRAQVLANGNRVYFGSIVALHRVVDRGNSIQGYGYNATKQNPADISYVVDGRGIELCGLARVS